MLEVALCCPTPTPSAGERQLLGMSQCGGLTI